MNEEIEEINDESKIISFLKKRIEHLEIDNQNLIKSIEKKKSQEKLYYNFFNTMPYPILLVDIDTFVILDCNNEFIRTYQIEREELYSNYSPSDFLPDLSIKNIIQKNKSYKLPYVHNINDKHFYVNLNVNSFQSDLSNYLIITININNIEE